MKEGHLLRAPLGALAGLAVLAAAASRPAPPAVSASTALIAEILGPDSRMDEDLRILVDEVGGRITGSAGYEKSLAWARDAFRRAGMDAVRLEAYDAPAKWEPESASARVVRPFEFPVDVVSFAMAPGTPAGGLNARLIDAGNGTKADFDRLGPKARGAIALVRSNPMRSFDDLFAEYVAGPEMIQSAVEKGAAGILFLSTRPRELLYRHIVTWDGTIGPLPMAQVAREDGLRLLRLLERGHLLEVKLDIRNRIGGAFRARNVVAEIKGSGKPDEIVVLGAHLDAWDLGTGALDNGRPELAPVLAAALAPVAAWGAGNVANDALLGTDNFDFLLEGVPNLVANQETEKYLPDYHAESDTYDKVDPREARMNAAVAAVAVSGLANARERLGPRQSREQVEKVLLENGLDQQMKAYGLWKDWETGKRGRRK